MHVVQLLCDEVIVMKDGQIVEQGLTADVMQTPKSDYTKSLLEAAPSISNLTTNNTPNPRKGEFA